MNFKDFNLVFFVKLITVATLIIIFLTRMSLWHVIFAAVRPVIYAFILAYILDYMVRFFENRLKLKRVLSIILSLIVSISTIVLITSLIVPRIIDAIYALVNAVSALDININDLFNQKYDNIYLNEIQQRIVDMVTPLIQKATDATGTFVVVILSRVQKITTGFISFLVALIISVYMLAEKRDLTARIKRLIYAYFNDKHSDWIFHVSRKAHYIFKDFVIGKLLDSLIIGFIFFVLLTIFQFPFALLITVIIAITNMIPYFGPFLGAIPATIITFIAMPDTPVMMIWMLVIIFFIQQLDGWVIGPIVVGDSVGVSAFWIILGVTIGGALFGVLGMFLGVPVIVLIKTLIEDDIQKRLQTKGYDGLEEKNITPRNKRKRKVKLIDKASLTKKKTDD